MNVTNIDNANQFRVSNKSYNHKFEILPLFITQSNQQENSANMSNIVNMSSQGNTSRKMLQEEEIKRKIEGNLKSGKIKRIHLKNFMCHGNFEVNLNSVSTKTIK